MTMQPTPARAPMTAQGAQILRPSQATQFFRSRLEPQILRNTPVQVLRTTPSWLPAATTRTGPPVPAPAVPVAAAPNPTAPNPAAPSPAAPSPAAPNPAAPSPATLSSPPPGVAPPATPATPLRGPEPAAPADQGPPLGPEEFAPVPGEMTFSQFMQGLNPLHHLPGVGTIYRAATGAEIHPVMRVLGGAAFGGPLGMILAAISAAIEQTRPLERLGHTLAGRPDPHMPAPNSEAARAAAAYARFGGAG